MPTVLCIDDQETGLATRKLLLETKGYEVLTATDAQTGLDLLAANEVAVVVLDYSMPGVNGDDTARRIKAQWPAIGIIMLSGYPDVPDAARETADIFITKGGPPAVFLSELERLVGSSPTPRVTSTVERSRELGKMTESVLERSQQLRTLRKMRRGGASDPESE